MCPLLDTTVSVSFGHGLDTKTDAKQVSGGKLLQLQDAVFTEAGAINKRNGYQKLPTTIIGSGSQTVNSPSMVKVLNDDLVAADNNQIYSYSPSTSAWASKGVYAPIGVSTQSISSGTTTQSNETFQSVAVLGNYTLFVWQQTDASNHSFTYFTVHDNVTKTAIIPSTICNPTGTGNVSFGTFPTAVTLNDTLAIVQYTQNNAKIAITPLVISSSGVTQVAPRYTANSPKVYFSFDVSYDIIGTSTGGILAYSTSSGIVLVQLDDFGNPGSTATISSATSAGPISLCQSPNSDLWVYWGDNPITSPAGLHYAVYNSSYTQTLAPTTIIPSSGSNSVVQVVAYPTSNTTQAVIYWIDTNGIPQILANNLTNAGTITSNPFNMYGVYMNSKPVLVNGQAYMEFFYREQTVSTPATIAQSVVFLVAINPAGSNSSFAVVGQALYGQVATNSSGGVNPGYLPKLVFLNSNTLVSLNQYALTVDTLPAQNPTPLLGSTMITWDFAAQDTFQAVVANNTLVLNGGIGWLYDGNNTSELGFLLYPFIQKATTATTGGNLGTGSFNYFAVLQWTDAQGNFYQSSPSQAFNVTFASGTTNVATITIILPTVSIKNPTANIAIYRTTANTNTAYLVSNSIITANNTATYTFTDQSADSQIISDNQLYTNGGVVENIVPPPFNAMTLHNNRVWLVDSTNPNTVWYSKTLQPGVGISFSDLLTAQIDAIGGKIVALAEMDSNLVIFEQTRPLVLAGDGANDTGTNSTLGSPQPIPSDVGCLTSKGVKTFPEGVLFKSSKGIYLLDRALAVKYLGMPVEGFNAQDIQSSTLIQDKSQIRFLTSSGLTLVYDYIFDQWSTFTNHQGFSADIWKGNYVYARTDGSIFVETPGYYLDNATPFALLAKTGWIKFAGLQGFQRVRRVAMLGDQASLTSSSGHGIEISAAYDYNANFIQGFGTPIPYSFTSTEGSFQYRERLPIQKCESLQLLIQEVVTGSATESLVLSDLALEVAVKKGMYKFGTGQAVG